MATHAAYSWGFCFFMHEPQTTCFKKCKVHHLHKQSQFCVFRRIFRLFWCMLNTHYSWGPCFLKHEPRLVQESYQPTCFKNVTFSVHNQSQVYEPRRTSNVFECLAALFLDFLRFLRVALRIKRMRVFLANLNFFSSHINESTEFFFAASHFDWPITHKKNEIMEAPQNTRFYFEV